MPSTYDICVASVAPEDESKIIIVNGYYKFAWGYCFPHSHFCPSGTECYKDCTYDRDGDNTCDDTDSCIDSDKDNECENWNFVLNVNEDICFDPNRDGKCHISNACDYDEDFDNKCECWNFD